MFCFFPPNFTHARHKSEFKREQDVLVKLQVQVSFFFLCISQSFPLGWIVGLCGRYPPVAGSLTVTDTVWRILNVLGVITAPWHSLHAGQGCMVCGVTRAVWGNSFADTTTRWLGLFPSAHWTLAEFPWLPSHSITTQHDIICTCVALGREGCSFPGSQRILCPSKGQEEPLI